MKKAGGIESSHARRSPGVTFGDVWRKAILEDSNPTPLVQPSPTPSPASTQTGPYPCHVVLIEVLEELGLEDDWPIILDLKTHINRLAHPKVESTEYQAIVNSCKGWLAPAKGKVLDVRRCPYGPR